MRGRVDPEDFGALFRAVGQRLALDLGRVELALVFEQVEGVRAGLGVEGTQEELEQTFLSKPTREWEEVAKRLDIPLIGIRDSAPRNSAQGALS